MIANGIDTVIPTKNVGPVRVRHRDTTYDVDVPLATFETPLWHSVNRGAKISQLCGGITSTVLRNTMTRSVSVMCKDAAEASFVARTVVANIENVKEIIREKKKKLKDKKFELEIIDDMFEENEREEEIEKIESKISSLENVLLELEELRKYDVRQITRERLKK